ncbi:MAG: CocE/NonD family hydrolase C-terminal non-catalytic domain-containing protein, partial [Propionibacteriaceae bacterium]|nr:CocE/NonD family hydrolase C-terminal non-catalytic domain-containing protein [Propionibacteriaceae bacterium]
PPDPSPGDVPGVWLATDWPTRDVEPTEVALPRASVPARDGWVIVDTAQHHGVDAGKFFPYGNPTDLPPDQRAEDGRGVAIDLLVAEEELTILGMPEAVLHLDSATPRGQVIARLCDVAPDGSSRLLSRGVLNLSSRQGRDRIVPFTPGEPETVRVRFTGLGVRIAAGHALRLVLSSTYWPWVWPQAETGALRVHLPSSSLVLPVVRPERTPQADEATWTEPEHSAVAEPVIMHDVRAKDADGREMSQREIRHDVETGRWQLLVDPAYGGSRSYPNGLEYGEEARESFTITDGDPLSAHATSHWRVTLGRDAWQTSLRTEQVVTADATHFVIRARVLAEILDEAGEAVIDTVADRTWDERIPRTAG